MDFSEIIIKAALNNKTPVNSDDYIGDNGILYCGKCHTQKQFELKGVLVPCICKCQAVERVFRPFESLARPHNSKI